MDTTTTASRYSTRARALLTTGPLLMAQVDMLASVTLGEHYARGAATVALQADPTVDMVWDEYGTPYYVNADRLAAALEVLPFTEHEGSLVLPVSIARVNSTRKD